MFRQTQIQRIIPPPLLPWNLIVGSSCQPITSLKAPLPSAVFETLDQGRILVGLRDKAVTKSAAVMGEQQWRWLQWWWWCQCGADMSPLSSLKASEFQTDLTAGSAARSHYYWRDGSIKYNQRSQKHGSLREVLKTLYGGMFQMQMEVCFRWVVRFMF